MKKRSRLMICLVAGVLILAVSATAAFGSVNGYAKYKNALKALALEEDNFTAAADLTMTMDGKEAMAAHVDYAMAAPNYSSYATVTQNGKTYEEYSGTVDGVYTCYGHDDTYYQSQDDSGQKNLLGFDADDEMQNRLVTFMEIAADTVVGDLKNNFVEVGSEGDSTLYQVNISNSQVPSLVNAGLSLFAYTLADGQSNLCQVQYEDYDANMFAYYEKQTGETLSEDFKTNYTNGWDEAWYEANEEQLDKFYEVTDGNWEDEYYKVLDNKGGGIVYVYADGTYDYYATAQEFAEKNPNSDFSDALYYYVGQDMVLDNVACTFGVDKDGKLTSNQIAVTFTTTDADGGHHELVISADVQVSGYGATVVQAPDLSGRTKAN